jgi:hypothetical protein
MTKTVRYTIPVGAQAGPLYFTVVDRAAPQQPAKPPMILNPPPNNPQIR